ncbi:MAG TPA: hypothetical protein VFE05_13685 [Longimicrobiaceae bacterium]|jgi:hypothetical protein|nr:hypothetical protein [Longimicrobiaceae bacterium]
MNRAPAVLLLLLVIYGFLSPPKLRAQDPEESLPAQAAKGFRLEQNSPNPVNPETWIPFYLEERLFKDGQPGVVSIRIYNVLRQLVAVPTAVGHPRGKDVKVTNLRYTQPGRKLAYWDGRDLNGRRVPSGLYYCELVVNDKNDFIRIVVVTPKRRSRFLPPFIGRSRS